MTGNVSIKSKDNFRMKSGVLGGNFKPTHIIYRKIAHDGTGNVYINAAKRRLIADIDPAYRKIEDFVAYAAKNDIKWEQEKYEEINDDGTIAKLAIPIQVHAYVVIHLDKNLSLTFDNNYPAVSLGTYEAGKKEADNHYGDCLHFDGTKLTPGDVTGSYIAVFSAIPRKPRTNKSKQPLNFNVIDGHNTDSTIDPDIRYPGTGGAEDGDGGPP